MICSSSDSFCLIASHIMIKLSMTNTPILTCDFKISRQDYYKNNINYLYDSTYLKKQRKKEHIKEKEKNQTKQTKQTMDEEQTLSCPVTNSIFRKLTLDALFFLIHTDCLKFSISISHK